MPHGAVAEHRRVERGVEIVSGWDHGAEIALHQIGVPFRIFEAVSELRPLGVGINLQPHAARELFELGLEPALDKVGLRTEEVAYFSAQGQLIWAESLATILDPPRRAANGLA